MGVQQHTVATSASCTGIGLHTGREVALDLMPGEAGEGVVFLARPSDDPTAAASEIPARFERILSGTRATVLGNDIGAQVSTVEHLLAALSVLGIDNARVHVVGGELPVHDGSAAPFVDWIRSAGRVAQARQRRCFRVEESFEIRDGNRSIRVEPAAGFGVRYAIDFDHPLIRRQSVDWPQLDAATFEAEVAPARTFGFEHEIAALRAEGLALGGCLENALVLTESGLLNDAPLRWPDEFVRHKVLDLLGDLALLGVPIRGRVLVERGGHALHHRLLAAITRGADFGSFVDEV